jgi:hypothetical protein
VHVRIAKEDLGREVIADEGRILFLRRLDLLFGRIDVLRQRRAAQQDDEGCGEREQVADYAM